MYAFKRGWSNPLLNQPQQMTPSTPKQPCCVQYKTPQQKGDLKNNYYPNIFSDLVLILIHFPLKVYL